jgi:hypothetical protein
MLMFVLLPVLIFSWITAYSQDEMEVIDNYAFDNPQREVSVFIHDEHNENAGIDECNACHHVYDDDGTLLEDESSEDQSCSECHDLVKSGRKPPLMQAYHFNCKGCHQKEKKGPIMCGECHQK